MPKYGNMGHFHLFFFGGGLETSLENIENKLKFREDVALRVYFLQKKNWNGIISSSILKIYCNMQEYIKMTTFSHFFPFFWHLKTSFEILSRSSLIVNPPSPLIKGRATRLGNLVKYRSEIFQQEMGVSQSRGLNRKGGLAYFFLHAELKFPV